jgi:endonuclease/exonuclease/phosphatase family metal-dependent hydrolase
MSDPFHVAEVRSPSVVVTVTALPLTDHVPVLVSLRV